MQLRLASAGTKVLLRERFLNRSWLGAARHPGVIILAGTEFWERVSFGGMKALLVLYMSTELLRPGHVEHVVGLAVARQFIERINGPLTSTQLAFQVFGFYIGLLAFSPVVGGLLGDRMLGRNRAVLLGGALMVIGHISLAFEKPFLASLVLLIVGAGLLRGNLVVQVGGLYAPGDRRRGNAFQIYSACANAGAFVAPLITGLVAQVYGWHSGFAIAAAGMCIGLGWYGIGHRYLPGAAVSLTLPDTSIEPRDMSAAKVLAVLIPVLTLFWIAQGQVWNVYNVWVRDHVDLLVAGMRVPVPWVQALDSLCTVLVLPPLLIFWRHQSRLSSEPDDMKKLAIGSLIMGGAMVWLALSCWWWSGTTRVPLYWIALFHVGSNVGYVYFGPVAISMFARLAPQAFRAVATSAQYLAIFFGSVLGGMIGRLYGEITAANFWMIHAMSAFLGAAVLLAMRPRVNRKLTR